MIKRRRFDNKFCMDCRKGKRLMIYENKIIKLCNRHANQMENREIMNELTEEEYKLAEIMMA